MIPITFRKVKSRKALQQIVSFLKTDVHLHGGTASETLDIYGQLWDIKVSSSPWQPIVIMKEVTRLEALALMFGAVEI